METNDRVKLIRANKKLTMEKFGAILGVGKTAISKIEHGENALTEQMCKAICREFNVSEEWLKDGVGGDDIVYEEAQDTAAQFAKENHLGNVEEVLIREYLKLNDNAKEMFRSYLRNVVAELMPDQDKAAAGDRELTIDEKVASYRAELEAEAASGKLGASQTGGEDIANEA